MMAQTAAGGIGERRRPTVLGSNGQELESIRSHLPTAQVRQWGEDCRGGAPR